MRTGLLSRSEKEAIFAAGVISAVLLVAAGARAASPVTIGMEPASPRVGDAVLLEVQGSPDSVVAGVYFLGKSFHLSRSDGPGRFWGLVPVPLATRPGVKKLSVAVWDRNGSSRWMKLRVRVRPRMFPSETLHVKSRFTRIRKRDRTRIREDRQEFSRALSRTSKAPLLSGPFQLPIDSKVTDGFGTMRIFGRGSKSRHRGVDLDGLGGEAVRAANRGRVLVARDMFYSGKTVVLDHGAGVVTMYFHLSKIRVSKGQTVATGQIIGNLGATGRVTGPHLHFGAKIRGSYVDPLTLCSLPLVPGRHGVADELNRLVLDD